MSASASAEAPAENISSAQVQHPLSDEDPDAGHGEISRFEASLRTLPATIALPRPATRRDFRAGVAVAFTTTIVIVATLLDLLIFVELSCKAPKATK